MLRTFIDINETVSEDFGVAFSTKTALPGVADLTHKILDDMDEPIIHHTHSGGVRMTNRHTRWEGEIRHEERRIRLIQEVNGRGAKVPRSKNRRGVDHERRVWWKDEVNNPHKARNNRNAASQKWYAEYLDNLDLMDDIREFEEEALCPFFGEDELVYTEDIHVELDDSKDWVEDIHPAELDDEPEWDDGYDLNDPNLTPLQKCNILLERIHRIGEQIDALDERLEAFMFKFIKEDM